MANVVVSNSAALIAALKVAKSGDTVLLREGSYSGVVIGDVKIVGDVTVRSLDASRPAVLNDFRLRDSSGLTFRDLEFAVDPARQASQFRVDRSSDVHFDKAFFHGVMDGTSAGDKHALIIANSRDVSVTNSRFEELTDAIRHFDNDGLTVSNNQFRLIHDNGVSGGGSSHVTVTGNRFSDFDHTGPIHPDAIQFFTTNTTKAATDIVVSNNVFNRGSGAMIQGVWFRDEVGGIPFERVTITDNTVVGSMYHGIGVWGAKDVTVSGNTIMGVDGQQGWIWLRGVAGATVRDNVAGDYVYDDSQVSAVNNVKVGIASAATARDLTTWFNVNRGRAGLSELFEAQVLDRGTLLGYVDEPGQGGHRRVFAETVVAGTSGADRLSVAGKVGDFRLDGGAGDDTLAGNASGTTRMAGGAGNDSYTVRSDRDQVVETADGGVDSVFAYLDHTLGANVETLYLKAGGLTGRGNEADNRIIGSTGADVMYGLGGNDALQGEAGADRLFGGDGDDRLVGGDGDDVLYGDAGDDVLLGGLGSDVLHGGAGRNVLEGGAGADLLYGGSGRDSFVFRPADFVDGQPSTDTVRGFSRAQGDKIMLNLIDANERTAADDAFAFIGDRAFGGHAGELRFDRQGDDGYLRADVDGDGVADWSILMAGVTSMASSDFLL